MAVVPRPPGGATSLPVSMQRPSRRACGTGQPGAIGGHARDAGVTLAAPRVLSVGDAAVVMVSVAAGLTGRNAGRLPGEAVNQTPAG